MSDQNETRRVAGLEATVGFATLVIKSLILINGGALIALLAFLGNIAGKGCKIPHNVSYPLSWYSWGLGLAVFAAMLAYIFQSFESETTSNKKEEVILVIRNKHGIWVIRIFACLLALISLGLFIWGCSCSINMFSSLNFS